MEQSLIYTLDESVSFPKFQAEIYALLDELRQSGELADEAKARNIDVNAILTYKNEELIGTRPEGGFDVATIAIILTPLAPLAVEIVRDLWKEILLPKIKAKWGVDALREASEEKPVSH